MTSKAEAIKRNSMISLLINSNSRLSKIRKGNVESTGRIIFLTSIKFDRNFFPCGFSNQKPFLS